MGIIALLVSGGFVLPFFRKYMPVIQKNTAQNKSVQCESDLFCNREGKVFLDDLARTIFNFHTNIILDSRCRCDLYG